MGSSQVGVRELRKNLSKYLRRVASGERLEVRERGMSVAVLAPPVRVRGADHGGSMPCCSLCASVSLDGCRTQS